MSTITLLGPQARAPNAGTWLRKLRVAPPVALITAGWQEQERDDGALREQLGLDTVNLELHRRTEQLFDRDPELFEALRRRQNALQRLQRLHRRRLDHALGAYQELGSLPTQDDLLEGERRSALEAVRELDRHHLERVRQLWSETDAEVELEQRESVVEARREVETRLAGCSAVVIAGGHVAVLLNRLRLFAMREQLLVRPVIAWSAGAMALAEQIVLFHDHPPWGSGNAELLDEGLRLCRGWLPLPDASRRLALDDRSRMARMAARFRPLLCLTLEDGGAVHGEGGDEADRGTWQGEGVGLLQSDGTLHQIDDLERIPT